SEEAVVAPKIANVAQITRDHVVPANACDLAIARGQGRDAAVEGLAGSERDLTSQNTCDLCLAQWTIWDIAFGAAVDRKFRDDQNPKSQDQQVRGRRYGHAGMLAAHDQSADSSYAGNRDGRRRQCGRRQEGELEIKEAQRVDSGQGDEIG